MTNNDVLIQIWSECGKAIFVFFKQQQIGREKLGLKSVSFDCNKQRRKGIEVFLDNIFSAIAWTLYSCAKQIGFSNLSAHWAVFLQTLFFSQFVMCVYVFVFVCVQILVQVCKIMKLFIFKRKPKLKGIFFKHLQVRVLS